MTSESVLYVNGRFLTAFAEGAPVFCESMLTTGGTIQWTGPRADAPSTPRTCDLHGHLVTPGFVDAHVHATSTGLALEGLDLTRVCSAGELLSALRLSVVRDPDSVIIGHGWDETTWTDVVIPTRAQIDDVVGDRLVYLSRIDVHSALASSALIRVATHTATSDGYHPSGSLTRAAHHRVREVALASLSAAQRTRAQRAFLAAAAARGIVSVHEMAGPGISSQSDLSSILTMTSHGTTPLVTGYWGELARSGGIEVAREVGARGVAGDLFIDGAIGSHTACLHSPYADDPHTSGAVYVTRSDVADHVLAATRAGLQAGFHVIGDAACTSVIDGFLDAEKTLGTHAIAQARHRLEHAEMLSDRDIEVMHRLNISASMQPVFDALWGGAGGMYEQRVGLPRARLMNRLREIDAAGVSLIFGSDSPVTRLGPWNAIAAAMHHHRPEQRVGLPTAFESHTQAGWRAAGVDDAGALQPGQQAHFAVWDMDLDQTINASDVTSVATVVSGTVIHDTGLMSP
jgi:hypothetical protein